MMILAMIPAFLFAMYERNGQHLEVILKNMINVLFLRPKKRPYRTDNFYAVIDRQNQLDKEVYMIVRQKTDKSGTESGKRRHRKSKQDG